MVGDRRIYKACIRCMPALTQICLCFNATYIGLHIIKDTEHKMIAVNTKASCKHKSNQVSDNDDDFGRVH